MVDDIAGYVGGCIDVLKGIIEFITAVFSGDWEKAWNGIKDIFKGICLFPSYMHYFFEHSRRKYCTYKKYYY